MRVEDFCDLSDGDRRVVAHRDDGVSDFFDAPELGGRAEGDLVPSFFDEPGREVEVGVADRGKDLVERQAERAEALRVELDPDFPPVLAPHADLRNARDSSEPLADLVFDERGEFDGLEVARDAEDHDGEAVDVELADGWSV